MSYIVFARKYRPQAFDEIVGQSHITTTLKNAITQDRVAHAYLFAGPRGIGKTTTARILAKALNCENGPTASPCNKCAACSEITGGTSLDILEIDGASNRGIDEIRNLRDNIKFAPSKGKYKIYIIDEVHMLTQEAFNALLKTLEEPPPHVKFIFATTQAHKVPPTILSRCQRFDFHRIATTDILENLKRIAHNEKLDVRDEALVLVSKYADGSMRDAEVILDQIASFTKGEICVDDVVKILGVIDEESLFDLSGSIKEKNPVKALQTIDRLVNDGKDIFQVITSLIEHFRNLAVLKVSKDLTTLLDISPEKLKRYETHAQRFSVEEILYAIYTLSGAIDFIRKSNMTKIPFETAMIKLARQGSVISLDELMEKINKLEAKSSPLSADPSPEAPPGKTPPAAEDTVSPPPLPAEEKAPAAPSSAGSLEEITGSWTRIVNYIKSKKMSVALYLQGGYPVAMNSHTVSIGFPKEYSFHKEALDTPDYKQLIEEAIRQTLKVDIRVKYVVSDSVKVPADTSASYPPEDPSGAGTENGEGDLGQKHGEVEPIIKDALEIFGGELKESKKGNGK